MKPFIECVHWPRRVLFLVLVGYAFLTFGRLFSAVLVASIFISLEAIFTKIEHNRHIINEFFSHYSLYEHKEKKSKESK